MNINEFLKEFQSEEIHYMSNPGNGGDALIAYGAFSLFKKNNLTIKIVERNDNLENKILFYAGGGNLNDLYTDCSQFIATHHLKAKKLIVLPHTVVGNDNLLKALNKNVYIICREKKSFEHVSKFTNLNVLLIEDLAFNINPFEDFKLKKTNSRLLYLLNYKTIISFLIKDFNKFKKILKSYKNHKILHAYREDSESSFEAPKNNIDISDIINMDGTMKDEKLVSMTTQGIFSFLNQFETIYTNRLHICIASALLNKNVYFYGNSYWKNESVYKHSIENKFPKVKWMGYEL
ncbi:polysaccharide pyruvyl transferase family protein [Maribacter dokdonensis]|uniref:polysaccharide pyruvyl transferase family protein n=1 Tax=Maribacter dokdonensis TaxID=320912 RepID=UPI002732AC47|nr:polysaccharide pyruvyl transferase family protein [Maribacter dokdonensis]MDP2525774.1 polysaccharide pyruvyl transferase family protein [Maribacter dokdonensis]